MIGMVALSYRFLGRRHPTALRRENTDTDQADPFSSPWAVLKDLAREPSRARLLLMAGIFCFAGMWAALRSLTTPYGTEVLGMTRGAAGGIALPGAIAFLICVVPLAARSPSPSSRSWPAAPSGHSRLPPDPHPYNRKSPLWTCVSSPRPEPSVPDSTQPPSTVVWPPART
ncbi:hypothetical protein ABZ672_46515 [Streptomyces mirabilis]|uniref:hypothetical protein n=1 Tax=Streptomyces mirabilis TaxID=68239 RepID=UPI0033DB0045